jgi:putative methionine-R-sulfoxide reductase with GAF domain
MTTPLALALEKAARRLRPHRDRLVEAWTRELAEVAPRVAPDLRAYASHNVDILLERLERSQLEALLADDQRDAEVSSARPPVVMLAVGAFHRSCLPVLVEASPDQAALTESLVALHELFDKRLEVFLRVQESAMVRRLAEAQDQAAQAAEKARELARANEALRKSEMESQHRAEQIDLLATVAHRIAAILDPERLMQEAAEAIQARTNHTYVAVVVLDDEGVLVGRWSGRAGVGRRSAGRAQGPAGGIIGRALRKKAPQLVPDVSKDPDYHADVPGTHAEMVIPLLDGGEAVGAIDFQAAKPAAFDLDDVAVGETIAEFLVVALRNARLFTEARRQH